VDIIYCRHVIKIGHIIYEIQEGPSNHKGAKNGAKSLN